MLQRVEVLSAIYICFVEVQTGVASVQKHEMQASFSPATRGDLDQAVRSHQSQHRYSSHCICTPTQRSRF